jgi:hypothetical protein
MYIIFSTLRGKPDSVLDDTHALSKFLDNETPTVAVAFIAGCQYPGRCNLLPEVEMAGYLRKSTAKTPRLTILSTTFTNLIDTIINQRF